MFRLSSFLLVSLFLFCLIPTSFTAADPVTVVGIKGKVTTFNVIEKLESLEYQAATPSLGKKRCKRYVRGQYGTLAGFNSD